MKKQLRLGKYPYTYARVSVMRSQLLSREEYHKLLKMSLNEIISFLQGSAYKRAIDELAVRYSGVTLMEMALNKNLVNTWTKLKRIASKEVDSLIDAYLAREDLYNMKTILRGLHTGSKPEEFAAMLLPAGQLTSQKLEPIIRSESIEDFLKKLAAAGIKFEKFTNALEHFKSKGTVSEIENALDREYYQRMIEFSKTIPNEGRLFKKFFDAEIDTTNIVNVLRLRKAGIEKRGIEKYAIGKPSTIVKKLTDASSNNEIAELLRSHVSETALNAFVSFNSISETELEMGKKLLKQTTRLLHQNPLTVSVILGYMFAKEIEVKNLKMLLRSRQLNLKEDFMEQQIII